MPVKFRGSMVAIVTPFLEGKVDEATLRRLIDFQIENGTQGIIPCGTTGESATLSHQEHDRVIKITVEQVNKRVPVIAGTGSNNTDEAVRLTKHAKNAGADGALLITPYYNKPTQTGLFEHFKRVALKVDIPIILYNIQGRTAVNMEPVTVQTLSILPNIVGIKEASGSLPQMMQIIHMCGPDFIVLSGDDALTFPLLCLGGKGVISVTANIVPQGMYEMCEMFLAGYSIYEVKQAHYRLLPIMNALFIETNPAPIKAAMKMMGLLESDEVRLPLVQMEDANRERLADCLKKYGLIK